MKSHVFSFTPRNEPVPLKYMYFVLIWQALISVVIMFGIQWGYALCNFLAFLMIYIYIGQFNPGVFPGKCLLMLKKPQKILLILSGHTPGEILPSLPDLKFQKYAKHTN